MPQSSPLQPRDERILVLAPTGRDSAMSVHFLGEAGLEAHPCSTIETLCEEMLGGCGLALLTGEAINANAISCVTDALGRQPAWSDVPLIVLTSGGGATPANSDSLGKLAEVGNVTLVERPVRGDTLLSAVKSALRARRRQYDVRQLLEAEVLAKEALQAGEEQLRVALDAAKMGTWQVAFPDLALECTPACRAHYGRNGELAFSGQDLFDSIHPKDQAAVRDNFAQALESHKVFEQAFRVIWPDLSLHWVLASGRATYDAGGNPVAMAGVTLDITDRMTAEQQREQLLARTQAARAEAESANRLKDDFLATISHELRTPLMAILGWTSLMRTGQVDADMAPIALETIERNARSQSQLINDLLDVSRIISGKLRLDPEPIEFAPVVSAAIAVVSPAAEEKNITLHIEMPEIQGRINGDAERLKQVAWNLLSNAIKFTPQGGNVYIEVGQTKSHMELVIADTGRGISAEFLDHVFDRFRQADQTSKRNHGGLGLGLSIVRQLVDLHGGTISAASEGEGKGSTFTVRIPLLQGDVIQPEVADQPEVTEQPPAFASPLKGLRVLVVDDVPDTRLVLKAALERHGSDVFTAANVPDAFELFTRWRPDVLVSDIGLPGEDGYALIRKIRALGSDNGGAVPAMALTAYVREEDRVKALDAGFETHLAKPLEPADFIAAVAELAGQNAK